MTMVTFEYLRRMAKRTVIGLLALAAICIASLLWLWNARADIGDTGLHPPAIRTVPPGAVTATWFGVSTILFDDGETQILIDGFFTRPTVWDVLLDRPVESGAATIDSMLHDYRIRRLAAIIPVHSHFDHAMDVGAIANRSSASILGSESTANIARGAGVPEDQIVVVEERSAYSFGEFTVTMIKSLHAPVGWRGTVPLSGTIDEPLPMPAPVTNFRHGGSYSVVVSHPRGTTIVQGSAGYIAGALDDVEADVVMLGVGLLEGLGRKYAEQYWLALVTATGAERVFPIHYDDYTRELGTIELLPRVIDNFPRTVEWLEEFRATWDRDTQIVLPAFGESIVLYGAQSPEA